MKRLFKKLVLYIAVTVILVADVIPVLAASPNEKCKITINEQNAEWNLEPFLAYGPQGDIKIFIPMKNIFTTLGYTVTYVAELSRSVFTADENSDNTSFYVDLKTGQIVKDGENPAKNAVNQTYLINNYLYIPGYELQNIAKLLLYNSSVKITYDYNTNITSEYYIIQYNDKFPVQGNLFSLTIQITVKYPDHPFVGEQYTNYNTGEWFTLDKPTKITSQEVFWDGFSKLKFFNGTHDKNPCVTTKGYALAWELMDKTGEEINKLRKQNGLSELFIDHSICFVSIGADNPKRDSVFDNAVWYWEGGSGNGAFGGHTPFKKIIKGECMSGTSIIDHGTTASEYGLYFVNRWKNSPAHKNIILTKKFTSVGILVLIDEYGKALVTAVFK